MRILFIFLALVRMLPPAVKLLTPWRLESWRFLQELRILLAFHALVNIVYMMIPIVMAPAIRCPG